MATKRTKRDDKESPSFEAALERLEQIVHDLEDGELGLDQSLQRYEEGVKHLKFCHQKLKDTEQKIELLTGLDAEGNPTTVPFDDPASSLEEKQQGRAKRRSHRPKQSKPESSSAPDVDIQGDLF
ncbi:MAG TPA: exodeoxyribonuclease VII small subunit [Pirellulaceae bacterium]|nr:exodeoxyribonuclease VII small subunit [Pirellulaceae bacterium]